MYVSGVNSLLGFIIILIGSALVASSYYKVLYYPRTDPNNKYFKFAVPDANVQPIQRPNKCFQWLWAAFSISDHDVLARSGIEALLYIKLMRSLRTLYLVIGLVGVVILLPVNNSQDENLRLAQENDEPYFSGFHDWTVSNIPEDSPLLWIHLCGFILFCFLFQRILFSLLQEAREVINEFDLMTTTTKYLSKTVPHFSVCLKNLPRDSRNPDLLRDKINSMYPGSVLSVTYMYIMPKLDRLYRRRVRLEQLKQQQEELLQSGDLHDSTVSVCCYCCDLCCGCWSCDRVDAMQYYNEQLELVQEVTELLHHT